MNEQMAAAAVSGQGAHEVFHRRVSYRLRLHLSEVPLSLAVNSRPSLIDSGFVRLSFFALHFRANLSVGLSTDSG